MADREGNGDIGEALRICGIVEAIGTVELRQDNNS
jgi:hypothetical protein